MFVRTFAILASVALLAAPAYAQTLDKAERACASAKLKATGKKAASKLKCEAKAIQKELDPTDPECLAKAEEKFLAAFAKAEAKGGCVSEGDAAAVEANVDEFVNEEVQRQKTGQSPPPSCPTLAASCGSCGSGICTLYSGGGNACINPSGAGTPGCMNDAQCPTGQHCVSGGGTTACAFPCP